MNKTVIIVIFINGDNIYLKDSDKCIYRTENCEVGEGPLFDNVARSLAESEFSNILNLYRVNDVNTILNVEYICYIAIPNVGLLQNIYSWVNKDNNGKHYKPYNINTLINENSLHAITKGVLDDYLAGNYHELSIEPQDY